MLLLFMFSTGPPTVVGRPGFGVIVERPVDSAGATVQRPGNDDIVGRPDMATGVRPWSH